MFTDLPCSFVNWTQTANYCCVVPQRVLKSELCFESLLHFCGKKQLNFVVADVAFVIQVTNGYQIRTFVVGTDMSQNAKAR